MILAAIPTIAAVPLRNKRGAVVELAIIDAEDADRASLHRWHLTKGYALATVRNDGQKRGLLLHRLILGLPLGDPRQVDHIDGQRLNCRRENLRIVAPWENAQNRKVNRTSATGIRGVAFRKEWRRRFKPWAAYMQIDGRRVELGQFATAEEAAACVAEARRIHMPYAVER